MLKDKSGEQVPKTTFKSRKNGEWNELSSENIFNNKKVIIFALPGAFTPTCSTTHLPRYDELAPTFKKQGIDAIYCLSVNDGFVMEAWAKVQNAKHIDFLADGNGEFSQALGMLVDKSNLGFGKRSWRYSMLVDNGTIKKMFIEPEKDGDPFEVSDADTMLNFINPDASLPPEVTIITKPGCPFCKKAKDLLSSQEYQFEEIVLGEGISYKSLRNLSGKDTAPQIFIDKKHIGGSEDLEEYLKKN